MGYFILYLYLRWTFEIMIHVMRASNFEVTYGQVLAFLRNRLTLIKP